MIQKLCPWTDPSWIWGFPPCLFMYMYVYLCVCVRYQAIVVCEMGYRNVNCVINYACLLLLWNTRGLWSEVIYAWLRRWVAIELFTSCNSFPPRHQTIILANIHLQRDPSNIFPSICFRNYLIVIEGLLKCLGSQRPELWEAFHRNT